jgi:hypothetical protein
VTISDKIVVYRQFLGSKEIYQPYNHAAKLSKKDRVWPALKRSEAIGKGDVHINRSFIVYSILVLIA